MQKRILAVDNDPFMTRSVRRLLEEMRGYSVMEVNDPTKAIAAAHAFRPDLFLLDLNMPEMDGEDLARLIEDDPALRHVPIVFLTAQLDRMKDLVGQQEPGNRVFLLKPVGGMRLMECIDRAIRPGGAPDPGV